MHKNSISMLSNYLCSLKHFMQLSHVYKLRERYVSIKNKWQYNLMFHACSQKIEFMSSILYFLYISFVYIHFKFRRNLLIYSKCEMHRINSFSLHKT